MTGERAQSERYRSPLATNPVGRRIYLNAPLIRPIAPAVIFGVYAYALTRVLIDEFTALRVQSREKRKNTALHYTGATLSDRNR